MARKRRRSQKKKYAANRRRRRGGISLAPRRVVIMRANSRRRKSRRHRRNPSLRLPAHIPALRGLLVPAIGAGLGYAGPYLIQPLVSGMLPLPTSGFGAFMGRAVAGLVTGILGNVTASTGLISKKMANGIWVGAALNALVNLLSTQSISIPGFSGMGYVDVPGVGPASMPTGVARFEPYMQ